MEFQTILREHLERYPLMQVSDCVKLAYQNALGPRHLASDRPRFLQNLLEEWGNIPAEEGAEQLEPIGNSMSRFHLTGTDNLPAATLLLANLVSMTARRCRGTPQKLEENLAVLETLELSGMAEGLAEYRRRGCPPVRHSQIFRDAYHPHYRLIRTEYAGFFPALLRIAELAQKGEPAVVAVDGCCGSGKTGFAKLVQSLFPCNVIHMDDFYLPQKKRPANWMETPGGNMDLKRILREVLIPAGTGDPIYYRPFDCRSGAPGDAVFLPACPLTIVEGSYSQHPLLAPRYDLRLFFTCSKEEQRRRLERREGEHFAAYESRWIPLEEHYIQKCHPETGSACVVDTTAFFP